MIYQENANVMKMTQEGDWFEGHIAVNFLYWVSKNANAGDELVVSDMDNNEIYVDVADGSNYKNIFPVKSVLNGIKILTMDSGVLYVIKATLKAGQW